MIKRRVQDMDGRRIEADGVEGVTMRVLVGQYDGASTFAMRHFAIDPGGCTPNHEHDWEHEVWILRGIGELTLDGEVHDISGGEALFVPGNHLHQFRNTGSEPLEFLCMVPMTSRDGAAVPGCGQ